MSNVILISLDTLRADVAYSGKFPTIEKLRSKGVTFSNTVASAPLTPISHASVFTGCQPPAHGIRHLFKEKMKKGIPTIASILKKNGYETGAIVSCPGMNAWYRLNQGFSFYDDEIPRLANGDDPLKSVDVNVRGTALKRAPLVVERALSWFDKHANKNKFLFMHFFDSHWPYEPPEKFGQDLGNPYEGEVAYMDYYLGVFFDELEKRGHNIDEDLVVLFSDHGEDLGGWYPNDHAGEELGHPEERGHGCLLFDATIMVPLIIKCKKNLASNHTIDTQVRLIDIAPTILDLLQLSTNEVQFEGESLTELFDEQLVGSHRPAYSETFYLDELKKQNPKYKKLSPLKAVRIANASKTIWATQGDDVQYYDLDNDPCEKNSLFSHPPKPVSE